MDRSPQPRLASRNGDLTGDSSSGESAIVPLTPDEECDLTQCEDVIRKGWRTFLEVGSALARIRDNRLYRRHHGTFEQYCGEKWGYQRAYAYRLILAAQAVAHLSPMGDIPQPTHERQVRPLLGLRPEQMQQAWRKAVEVCNGAPIEAEIVKRIVDELNPHGSASIKPKRKSLQSNPRNHLRSKAEVLRLIAEIEKAFGEADEPDTIIRLLEALKHEVTAL
jgi:hypothetical protein